MGNKTLLIRKKDKKGVSEKLKKNEA